MINLKHNDKEVALRAEGNFLSLVERMLKLEFPINEETRKLMVKHGRLYRKEFNYAKSKKFMDKKEQRKYFLDQHFKINEKAHDIQSDSEQQVSVVTEITKDNVVVKANRKITKKDWSPRSVVYHTGPFVKWINSINSGFKNRIEYEPYNLYVQQADQWYAENGSVTDYHTLYDKDVYTDRELDRISNNVLYFANKYGYLEEATFTTGRRKYYATDNYEHQRIQCFLIDCGYSILEGKPRQVGDTSIKGLIAVRNILMRRNFYLKFITEDKLTGEEIFDAKIKFPFSQLQNWMRPRYESDNNNNVILNDTDRMFRIGKKIKKGGDKGINSRMEIVAPSKTAINGGSPSVVFIDEVDSIKGLTDMITEGRPTLYRRNADGQLEQVRQLVMWGTGTSKNSGGDFEREWKRVLGLWNNGDYEVGIVPIFYDWSCRCDESEYLRQKNYYYGARTGEEEVDRETSIMQFHQHYPATPEDMFSSDAKLLVSRSFIEENIKRIDKSPLLAKRPILYGYFEPVYDTSKPKDENSDTPYYMRDAIFIPVEQGTELAVVTLFKNPEKGWINRYFAGTDPLSSDTGLSKQAMAVWDKRDKTVDCVVNHRKTNDLKFVYRQCLLMGLYYDTRTVKKRIPELVERNISKTYVDYLDAHGFRSSLIYDGQLPELYRSNSKSSLGIDNKTSRNEAIITKISQTATIWGERLFIRTFWVQLRTFVAKITKAGNATWGTMDPRVYNDDVLFAIAFSAICSECFMKNPEKIDDVKAELKKKHRLIMGKEGLTREISYKTNYM